MDRFVAFRWDTTSAEATARTGLWLVALQRANPGWVEVSTAPGFRVVAFQSDKASHVTAPTSNACGVIIGKVFEQGLGSRGRLTSLSAAALDDVLRAEGRPASGRLWGSFVAIAHDAEAGTLTIARDPCGATPCFLTRAYGVDIACACVADIAALPGLTFSIDWHAVRAFLIHEYFITRHTGLRELREVLPGQRLIVDREGGVTAVMTWSPAQIAAAPNCQDFASARDELRSLAEDVFAAWGATYNHVAIRLSGGLDSSIVAAMMKRASTSRITGIHFVGRGYESFELKLARLAAARAGIALREIEMTPSTSDLSHILKVPRLPRPTGQILGASADAVLSEACREMGCDSIMTGHGGDSLFLQRAIAGESLTDYVRLNGLTRSTLRIAYETATLVQLPVFEIAGRALGQLVRRRRWQPLAFLSAPDAPFRRFLPDDSLQRLPAAYARSEWLEEL